MRKLIVKQAKRGQVKEESNLNQWTVWIKRNAAVIEEKLTVDELQELTEIMECDAQNDLLEELLERLARHRPHLFVKHR